MSRGILPAAWGSRGASGALRAVAGLLEEGDDTTRTGEMDGILVRRYDIGDDLWDEAAVLSGARSRFDSSIEGRRVQRICVCEIAEKFAVNVVGSRRDEGRSLSSAARSWRLGKREQGHGESARNCSHRRRKQQSV